MVSRHVVLPCCSELVLYGLACEVSQEGISVSFHLLEVKCFRKIPVYGMNSTSGCLSGTQFTTDRHLEKRIVTPGILWILHELAGASLVAQLVRNLPAAQETRVRFLGGEDPQEKG